jgi:hypothetical protein
MLLPAPYYNAFLRGEINAKCKHTSKEKPTSGGIGEILKKIVAKRLDKKRIFSIICFLMNLV